MLANIFESHGEFCAEHPWEVIVGVLTLTACMLSMDNSVAIGASSNLRSEETNAVDIIFMTIIRCVAVLYSYYQFCKLRKLGSNYILGIAGLFTVFSSFVFSSTIINFLRSDVSDLKDALFFFVLVIDLSKASVLAQFALSSASQKEANQNIARGMALLGPTITLDTLVGTLVISVGTLSGVKRLEMLCCFACFSFVVNYFVFMTFYPACLSLVLELSRSGSHEKGTCFQVKSPLIELLYEDGHKPNPVVQRVKVIMSAGMMIVHAHSRWTLNNMENNEASKMFPVMSAIPTYTMVNNTDEISIQNYFMRFLAMCTDHILILILILALTVKFVFFDDKEEFTDKIFQIKKDKSYNDLYQTTYYRRIKNAEDKYSQTEKCEKNFVNISCQTDSYYVVSSYQEDIKNESTFTQTDISYSDFENIEFDNSPCRSMEECEDIFKKNRSAEELTDREIYNLVKKNVIRSHQLETIVDHPVRGVGIRRIIYGEDGHFQNALKTLPYHNYDYSKVVGACCENVIGYVPVPVGISGPLLIDGGIYYVPMATTEGCLVASTNRGSRALLQSGGICSRVVTDSMTRGPVVEFLSVKNAYSAMLWINDPDNFEKIRNNFNSTSRFIRLQKIFVRIIGNKMYIRFSATTGDAMGMNMISKATETALNFIKQYFPDMQIISLSGNFCTDKKPSALNWIEGRGKGVVCEAVVPADVIKNILKTSSKAMVDVNISKNMIGSAAAGSIGGFNAHAANIVTAIYIATGQDPAQNVCSSNCMTLMERCGEDGNDLYISCTMPSIEIGTVGGGTALPAQAACLEMLGVKGANKNNPGENARTLARIVCATVLAGELSLMAALTAGHLVQSHLTFNRTSLAERSCVSNSRKSSVTNEKVIGNCVSN